MLRVTHLKLPNHKVLNFHLADGEGLIISGKNGSGKSLLLKSLALLSPSEFERYEYKGVLVNTVKPEEFRRDVLYLSTAHMMMREGSVEDFFHAPLKLAIYQNHKVEFDYKKYLDKWHIPTTNVSLLSTGQKQMISILRALTLKAKVLLLDEPTANLDHEKTLEIEELLLDWKKRTGGSFVFVGHSKEQIQRLGLKAIDFEELVIKASSSI